MRFLIIVVVGGRSSLENKVFASWKFGERPTHISVSFAGGSCERLKDTYNGLGVDLSVFEPFM